MENENKERNLIYFKVKYNHARQVEDATANEVTDHPDIRECECVLCLPDSYSENGDPTPLIMSFHGAGSRVCEADGKVGGVKYVYRCVDNGYAALDVCGSELHGTTMGCPEHIFAAYKAYIYAVHRYNLTKRVFVAGASMGGHTAMNFANTFPGIVVAIGMFYPRLNIDGVTVNGHYCIGTWDKRNSNGEKPSTHQRILDVYRLEKDQWCEKNFLGFNPYRTRAFINSEGERVVIPPCPIKIWQGLADTTVDPVMVTEFVNSVRRSGSYIEYHMLEGVAHKMNDVMYTELVYWFDRFVL